MSERIFDLGDILTVTTGRLVSKRGIEACYDLLNYMTCDNLLTHQLPRAMRECAPWLLRQHPQLAEVTDDDLSGDNWREWLGEQEARFGTSLSVTPIPADHHARRDPIEELATMVGEDRMIVLRATGAAGGEQ